MIYITQMHLFVEKVANIYDKPIIRINVLSEATMLRLSLILNVFNFDLTTTKKSLNLNQLF